jgi:hypothetical protein
MKIKSKWMRNSIKAPNNYWNKKKLLKILNSK